MMRRTHRHCTLIYDVILARVDPVDRIIRSLEAFRFFHSHRYEIVHADLYQNLYNSRTRRGGLTPRESFRTCLCPGCKDVRLPRTRYRDARVAAGILAANSPRHAHCPYRSFDILRILSARESLERGRHPFLKSRDTCRAAVH